LSTVKDMTCGRFHAHPEHMAAPAPGRCADCGGDAYIQLAIEDAMLCAHCYASRLGLSRVAGRKGGERQQPLAQPRRSS